MPEVTVEGVRDAPAHAAVVYVSASQEAVDLRNEVNAQFRCQELYTAELSPLIGTHVGPGTVGVAF
jgi:fatty acid-binding protein DegV